MASPLRTSQEGIPCPGLDFCKWRIDGRNGVLALLGMKRSTLYDKLRRYGLKKPAEASG